MTYATGRRYLDADSHLMEMPGFLDPFIEHDMRDRLRDGGMRRLAPLLERAADDADRRRSDPEARAALERLFALEDEAMADGRIGSDFVTITATPKRETPGAAFRRVAGRVAASIGVRTAARPGRAERPG